MFFKKKKYFSTFWFLILVLAVIWFFSDLGYLRFNVPWLALIVMVVALGALINRMMGK